MGERKTNVQGKKPKVSKLVIASPLVVLLGYYAGLTIAAWLKRIRFFALAGFWICILSLLAGLITGIIADRRIHKSKGLLTGRVFSISGTILALILIIQILIPPRHPRREYAYRIICGVNLRDLGLAMQTYASDYNNKYPTADKWCDLLLQYALITEEKFVCREAFKKGNQKPCHYAINPNCEPNSPNDVVLLFETKGGWNQFGGPEILTTENHKGKGCNVLFNDGHVEFIKTEQLVELKWKVEKEQNTEEQAEDSGNFRRPENDKELKYWLKNMVWYHHFTNEEIAVATGLTNKEIAAALKKFDIRLDNQPKRDEDGTLLVLPYPGGRHPRIGFLEGAIDPQRETKLSVFTPWDKNSYVVVDLPEAIWSNLGLTYLAHTHIDTIWTKQGIELKKLEWNRYPNRMLDVERKLPNGIVFGAKVKPTKKAVRMEMWLKNGTNEKLTDLRVQICVMPKMAAGFEQQTNDNKVFTNPYVACRSNDGRRWIITAWEGCHRPWGNARCPCFHSDPKFPDLEPGEMKRLGGWLSFYEGTDIEAEFKRIEETGWRRRRP